MPDCAFETTGRQPKAVVRAWEHSAGPALHWSLSGRRQRLVRAAGFDTPFWILGAAAGAAVAIEFALRHPQQVAGLILCAPALGTDADRRDYLESRASLAQREGMRSVVDAVLARSYPPACRRDDAVYSQYRQQLLACDPMAYALANRALVDMDLAPRLPRIDVPCLLLAGRHDILRPCTMVHGYAQALRGARCIEIDSGHLMAVQTPELVAAEVRRFVGTSHLSSIEQPDAFPRANLQFLAVPAPTRS